MQSNCSFRHFSIATATKIQLVSKGLYMNDIKGCKDKETFSISIEYTQNYDPAT